MFTGFRARAHTYTCYTHAYTHALTQSLADRAPLCWHTLKEWRMGAGKRGLECGLTTLQALAYDIVTSFLMVKQVDPPPPSSTPPIFPSPVTRVWRMGAGTRSLECGLTTLQALAYKILDSQANLWPPPFPPSPPPVSCHQSSEDGCRKARFRVRSNNTPSIDLRHTSSMVVYPLAFIF